MLALRLSVALLLALLFVVPFGLLVFRARRGTLTAGAPTPREFAGAAMKLVAMAAVAAVALLAAMWWSAARAGTLAGLQATYFAMADSNAPVLVLGGGTKINIDGRPGGRVVEVFGDDPCPEGSGDRASAAGPKDCIHLDKPVVQVRYIESGALVAESWKLDKRGDAIFLQRPDGTRVADGR